MLGGRSGETSETGLVDGGHKLDDFGFRIAESAFHSMLCALCPMLNYTSDISHPISIVCKTLLLGEMRETLQDEIPR
jgi:hypothetical protein